MSINNNVLIIIFFSMLFSLSLQVEKKKSFKELIEEYLSKLEINDAYLSYNQYISLINKIKEDYPKYIELSSIGKTYENNDIPIIKMKSPLIDNNNTDIKSGILFNGMHHGREPVSMMMNIYLILHLLSLPKSYLHLFLSTTNIFFIPIVNIDTYKYNSEQYLAGLGIKNMMARKNRRIVNNTKCKGEDIGVDLNRNYDYYFGSDNEGSSNSPCQEDYRGEYPFSEPETKAIKNFVELHPEIKIVYNYHTWGNLIITAFNCLSFKESDNLIKSKYPIHYKMYEDFKKEGEFPQNFLFGNADSTIKYKANGDATDWFLGKKNILSFSPELGNGNKNSDYFYPNKEITFDVLNKNLHGGLYAIQKSMFYLKAELLSAIYYPCTNKNKLYQNYNIKQLDNKKCFVDDIIFEIKTKIINKGFADYIPGLEFPIIVDNNGTSNYNKKYLYFLAFDLFVNIDKIKTICYWNTLQTLYISDINNKEKKKEEEKMEFVGKVRCVDINNNDEINDFRIFIDNEIKSMGYIILNIILLAKKESVYKKLYTYTNIYNNSFLQIDKSNYNDNQTNIFKIYTKENRIIKSEKINGEIIEWKFNIPFVEVKIKDLKNQINNLYSNKNFYYNTNKAMFFIFVFLIAIMVLMFTVIKQVNRRNITRLLINSSFNNNEINFGINNEQVVNNLENANQNNMRNNENIPPVQIPRNDNEIPSNSHDGSPNQLNT